METHTHRHTRTRHTHTHTHTHLPDLQRACEVVVDVRWKVRLDNQYGFREVYIALACTRVSEMEAQSESEEILAAAKFNSHRIA